MWTLGIDMAKGLFNCFRCGTNGNWFQFKKYLRGNLISHNHENGAEHNHHAEQNVPNYSVIEMHKLINNLEHNIYPDSIKYLTDPSVPGSRHLKLETLKKFKVGLGQEKFCD